MCVWLIGSGKINTIPNKVKKGVLYWTGNSGGLACLLFAHTHPHTHASVGPTRMILLHPFLFAESHEMMSCELSKWERKRECGRRKIGGGGMERARTPSRRLFFLSRGEAKIFCLFCFFRCYHACHNSDSIFVFLLLNFSESCPIKTVLFLVFLFSTRPGML